MTRLVRRAILTLFAVTSGSTAAQPQHRPEVPVGIAPPPAAESDGPRKSRPVAPTERPGLQFAAPTDSIGLMSGLHARRETADVREFATFVDAVAPVDAPAGPAVIHIGIAYTRAAAKRMLSRDQRPLETQLASAVTEANDSFVASGIDAVLKLDETHQTEDNEAGEARAEVRAMIDRKDGRYDELPAWRRRIGASAVLLIVGNSNRCGWGPAIPATAAEAYAMVREDCIRNFMIPHEIGHLIGASHNDATDAPFSYGRGYVSREVFQTIMGNSTAEKRIGIWAGPDIRWEGRVTGNAERNNDARVINERARIFARFRGD